jgi:hypothetical protein
MSASRSLRCLNMIGPSEMGFDLGRVIGICGFGVTGLSLCVGALWILGNGCRIGLGIARIYDIRIENNPNLLTVPEF